MKFDNVNCCGKSEKFYIHRYNYVISCYLSFCFAVDCCDTQRVTRYATNILDMMNIEFVFLLYNDICSEFNVEISA